MKVIILFIVLVAVKLSCGTDPAKCQRFIKYMLINSCGATKRHSNSFTSRRYSIYDLDEMDDLYRKLVETGAIKGLETGDDHLTSNTISSDHMHLRVVNDQLLFNRWKRDVIGSMPRKKDPTEPIGFDRRGGFHPIFGSPPSEEHHKSPPLPVALKAKCCGEYLCSSDDFKGFCG